MQLRRARIFLVALLISFGLSASAAAEPRDPLGGWEVLGPDFPAGDALDFASYEWEYFTIWNEDRSFYAVVGYVLADPRNVGGDLGVALVPAGASMAVSTFEPGRSATADFSSFGIENTEASADEKFLLADDPETGNFGLVQPAPGATSANPALQIQGRNDRFEWDLIVSPDFLEYLPLRDAEPDAAFSAVRGDDVGLLGGENWTVDAVWPRTRIEGTFTDRATGEVIDIAAKGYRENSFGRYLLSADGWDFAVFSDTEERVQMMLQTYHRSEVVDYFDISFPDEYGQPRNVRFRPTEGELGWFHGEWAWDDRAHQCVPERTWFVADDGEFRVEVRVDMSADSVVPYAPFLNDETLGTAIFFIMEQYPMIRGRIYRSGTGQLVRTFEGRGGGEFALRKALIPKSDFACWLTSAGVYRHPFPR